MKHRLFGTLILLGVSLVLIGPAEKSQAQPVTDNNKVIPVDFLLARVGNELVLFSDLQRLVRVASRDNADLLPDGSLTGEALKVADVQSLLDTLIDGKVLNIRAKELGLSVDDHELDLEINKFLKAQGGSAEDLQAALAQQGETMDEYRDEFRRQLQQQRVIGQIVQPRVSVTDDEVRSFFMQNADSAVSSQVVRLRSLSVNLGGGQSPEEQNRKQDIVEKITQEAVRVQDPSSLDFQKLVRTYSDAPDAQEGGDLPPRPLADLPAIVKEKIKPDLPVGTVIGPVKLGSTVFFFQFLGMNLADEKKFEEQKNSWRQKLLETKQQEGLSEYLRAERTKIKIAQKEFNIHRGD